jgi:HAD superfamily hydrolase (TIGR01484 family)
MYVEDNQAAGCRKETGPTMRPLAEMTDEELRGIRVLLSDIDDTITSEGRLTARAYAALERLQEGGLKVVPITGRPAGWCDHIARMWPVDGIVGENGAFYMVYDRAARRMRQHSFVSAEAVRENRAKLDRLADTILAEVPGAALASDQPYRLADLAIDFCEDVPPLPREAVDRIVALFAEAGAQAKVSSIHVNGWFGTYDKLSMAREFLARECGIDAQADNRSIVFAGDSPNDEPMFGAFALSVGVANIRAFADRLVAKPKFVTAGHSGDGFVELAERILTARGAA